MPEADGGATVRPPALPVPSPLVPVSPQRPSPQIPIGAWPKLQDRVPEYALTIAASDLAELDKRLDRTFEVPATFVADGVTHTALARYRGRSSMNVPKKSWEITVTDVRLPDGRKTVALLAAWKDAGYLTEKLWYDLAAAAGLRVPWTRYVNLTVNGGYYGVMVEIEKVNTTFLVAHGFDEHSDIYRCGQNDCELRDGPPYPDQEPWEKRTNTTLPWDGLWQFLHTLNHAAPDELPETLDLQLALNAYVRWLAVDAVISNSIVDDSRSFLVYDPAERRWTYVPWDLNNAHSLYSRLDPIDRPPLVSKPLLNFTAYNPKDPPRFSVLNTRIVDDPGLRAQYRGDIEKLLQSRFTEAEIGARVDAVAQLLAPHVARDPFVDQAYAARAPAYLKEYARGRIAVLEAALPALERHGKTALKVDRVGRDDAGRVFVEIYNSGSQAQSLAGLFLTGYMHEPRQSKAPAVTLGPGAVLRLEGATLGASIDPARPSVVLLESDGMTPVDLVYFAPLNPGEAYGRIPRGAEESGSIVSGP